MTTPLFAGPDAGTARDDQSVKLLVISDAPPPGSPDWEEHMKTWGPAIQQFNQDIEAGRVRIVSTSDLEAELRVHRGATTVYLLMLGDMIEGFHPVKPSTNKER